MAHSTSSPENVSSNPTKKAILLPRLRSCSISCSNAQAPALPYCGMEPAITALKKSKPFSKTSITGLILTSGGSLVCALLPMRLSKTRLKMFGFRRNASFANTICFADPSQLSSDCSSSQPNINASVSLSCPFMVLFHESFRTAIVAMPQKHQAFSHAGENLEATLHHSFCMIL